MAKMSLRSREVGFQTYRYTVEVYRKGEMETLFRIYASPDVTYGGHVTNSLRVKIAYYAWTEEETDSFLQVIKE